MNLEETTNKGKRHSRDEASPRATRSGDVHKEKTGHEITELWNDAGTKVDGLCCFHCDWIVYNRSLPKKKVPSTIPALGGRSIQSEGPSDSECEGDRPKATPKESVICVEALEKEGWEKTFSGVGGYWEYSKGDFIVYTGPNGEMLVSINQADAEIECEGCKSMPDLRTLTRLVNGD